ncbi:hypothetical protein PtB15_3B238 [Puccinia triticina]|nr:hypothetical protein PtB15_3B238 [Puccinia triticina]
MTQNNKFRSGIRLVRLVAVIFLVNGCKPMDLPNSQLSAEWFAWDEDLVDLDHIFPSGGSSGDEAAGQADTHHEPFAGGHLHPIGLPAGPSASHVCPPQDYHHIQTAAEQRPSGTLAHGKRMSLDLHNLFGSGFEPAQNFELLDQLLADGTPASNGFAAAGASRALDHIFPSALSSQARAAGQANHPQPSSALASDQSLLPDYYYPAQTNAKERTVNSQPYHALDISFDSGELFEPGLLPHDFDILTEFLGHGTPDPDGLTGVRAAQSHHGVAHVSDSHSHTFTGPGPSNLPAFSDYPFMRSSGTTSGLHESPSRKRKQTVGLQAKSIKPQDLLFTQSKPRSGIPKLYIPFPESQRPALSKKLPPQGPLGYYMNDLALNNPSDRAEQMEMGRLLTGLKALGIPNPRLVLSELKFYSTHRDYVGFGIERDDSGRTIKLSRGFAKSKIFDEGPQGQYKRRCRLAKGLVGFVSHYKDWYQHWFDETGIDFEKNLLQPHFIGFEEAAVLFPLYLFYVEMICSIVPREETTLKIELLTAQKLFNSWTMNYNIVIRYLRVIKI